MSERECCTGFLFSLNSTALRIGMGGTNPSTLPRESLRTTVNTLNGYDYLCFSRCKHSQYLILESIVGFYYLNNEYFRFHSLDVVINPTVTF